MTRGPLPFRHAAVAAGLVLLFPLLTQACGGRNELWEGEASDGAGGFEASGGFGGFGEGGFGGDGGFGGFGGEGPVTMSANSSVSSTTSTNASSAVSSSASSAVSSSVSTSVSTAVSSSAVSSSASSAVSSSASTSVSTAVSTSVTVSSAVSSSGVGGAPATTTVGAGGFGGGGPLDCINCITNNCPQALQCITNPACLQGASCTVQNCLGSGPPNFVCILNCFNGDLGAALQALGAIGCVANQCNNECQGLL